MKYFLFFLLTLFCCFSVYAESDVEINERFISIQKYICSTLKNEIQTKCENLSKTFLPDTTKSWKVSRVIDGDTIVIKNKNESIKVRLMGIDTPETKSIKKGIQCYGPEAYSFTKAQIEGKSVLIKFDNISGSKDIYDRYLAYIYIDKNNKSINQTLIEEGFAREYSMDQPYEYRKEFQEAQKTAQNNEKGLWKNCKEQK